MINPRGVKIVANTVGFFIANDAEEVRRANAFCKVNVGFFIANDAEEVCLANVFCKVMSASSSPMTRRRSAAPTCFAR